jgi:outer membrane protein TolC
VVVPRLSVDTFPELTPPVLVVGTQAPGLGPKDVEKTITWRVEKYVSATPGVDHVQSQSRNGLSVVYVWLRWGTDWAQDSYPGYYVGLKFSCPIGNRTSRARLAQARAATRDSELTLADTRTGVLLEVEHAFNDLTAARKEVEAADKALAFRGESLDAEMSKFKEGMSTSFFVLQRQEELDQARTNDLDARIDAERARTRFERAMGTLGEALDQAPDRRL